MQQVGCVYRALVWLVALKTVSLLHGGQPVSEPLLLCYIYVLGGIRDPFTVPMICFGLLKR